MPPNLAAIYGLALAAARAVAAAHIRWTVFPPHAMAAALVVAVVVFFPELAALVEHKVTTAVTAVLLALRAVTERLVVLTMLVRAAAAVGVLRAVVQPIPQTRQAVALGVRLLTKTTAL